MMNFEKRRNILWKRKPNWKLIMSGQVALRPQKLERKGSGGSQSSKMFPAK